ncbi:Transducin-like enhancer protein 4 [Chytriomyces hyalinus]|nr:Transducin-like enhancer protein 4 [Chytriomyces hyalinus]
MSITNLQQSKAKRVASVHPKVARNSQTSNSAILDQSTLSGHSDSPAAVVTPSPAGVSQQRQQHSSNQQQPLLQENRSSSSSSHSWFQTALDTPIHSTVSSSAPVPSGSNRDSDDVGQMGAMSSQNGANAAALLQALSKPVEQPQNEHDHANTWTNATNYFGADNSLGTSQSALAFHSALAYHSTGFGGQEVHVGASQTPRNMASSGSTFTFPEVSSADQEEDTLNEGLDDRDFYIDGPLPSFTRKIRFQTDDLVSSVFFANPFGLAYTGSSKNELQIWNILKSLEENIPTHAGTLNLEGETAGYTRVIKVSPNGHTMVCGGEYNEIILSDATSTIPNIRSRMRAESGPTFSATFMADDRTMVTTHGNGAVELWDVHNARWIRTLGRHELDATCCGIINEADQIISGSGDKTVRIWDVRGGTYSGEGDAGSNYEVFRLGMENDVYCLGCDPERDGTVAIGLSSGMISLISFAQSQAPVLIEDVNDSIGKGITSLKYSHGGNWLVSTGMDQKLSIWSPNLEKLAEMEEPGVIISNDVFSSMSNGLYILNGLTDKSAVLHYADC